MTLSKLNFFLTWEANEFYSFLKENLQIATRKTFGRLLSDLDPKTFDCLQFCSTITQLGPSVFYVRSDKPYVTHLLNDREKCFILKQMLLLSYPELRKFSHTSEENSVLVLRECLYNVIRGHMKVHINNLEQYENIFKFVLPKNILVW